MKTYLIMGSLLLSHALHAETLQLLPPSNGDLQVLTLRASKAASIGSEDRQPVQFVWPLAQDSALAAPTPYLADSREFWVDVDAKQLANGYAIHTTSPGALIRVSVAGDAKAGARLPNIEIEHAGQLLSEGNGLQAVADHQALKAAGVEFGRDTQVYKLDDALPAGRFVLRAPKANAGVLLHVNEPQSDLHLQLQTEASTASAGSSLTVKARLLEGEQDKRVDRIGGLLTAPNGDSFVIEFKPSAEGYVAKVRLPKAALAGPELWDVHGFASVSGTAAGVHYLRDAKTSFAMAAGSARFTGSVEKAAGRAIALNFAVEAASAGRFELRGTLYGTRNGELVPFAQAHSAAWLEAGAGSIPLNVSSAMLKEAGVSAPFEIRALELNDQSRLAKIEQRAMGLRID